MFWLSERFGLSRSVSSVSVLVRALCEHGVGHLFKSRDIGARHEIVPETVALRRIHGIFIDVFHRSLQPGIHLFAAPGETLAVLAHLKPGHADTSRIDGL